jgi:hypothetical protein
MIENFDNPEILGNIFKKLGSQYRIEFIKSLSSVLNDIWEIENLDPKAVYIEDTRVIDDFRWVISNGAHIEPNSYQFGHDYFCMDEANGKKYECFTDSHLVSPIYIHENFVEKFNVNPCDPIITYVNTSEIVLPAFIIQILIRERNTNYKNDFLSLSVGSLLPNTIIKAATLTKWSRWFVKNGNLRLFEVDPSLKAADEAAKILKNGIYLKNPTITKVKDLTINPSGTIRGKARLDPKATTTELLNGKEFMYVIDESGDLLIGTRARGFDFSTPPGKASHPTLIGGAAPRVQAAGIIEFRGGKIYQVDNASGHYKPSLESLKKAEEIFRKIFPTNSFDKNFKGFIPYGN